MGKKAYGHGKKSVLVHFRKKCEWRYPRKYYPLVWTNTQKTLLESMLGKWKMDIFKNVQNENPNVLLEIMFLKTSI
jgi:hypothetical protein